MNISSTVQSGSGEGPIVAHQYPEKVQFSDIITADELRTQYGHLTHVDYGDKDAVTALRVAIKTVASSRKHIAKQEKIHKDPLNLYRQKIINYAKTLITPIKAFEKELKDEMARMDEIKLKKEAEQRQRWMRSLDAVRELSFGISTMTAEELIVRKQQIKDFDWNTRDFGEMLDSAKAEMINATHAVDQAIEFRRQQDEFAKQQAAQAEKDAKAQKLVEDQAAEIARLSFNNNDISDDIIDPTDDDPFDDIPYGSDFKLGMDCGDQNSLREYSRKIEALILKAPIVIDGEAKAALNRCTNSLTGMVRYLNSVADGGNA